MIWVGGSRLTRQQASKQASIPERESPLAWLSESDSQIGRQADGWMVGECIIWFQLVVSYLGHSGWMTS